MSEMVERVARAIEAKMFAPHELPICGELHDRYLETAGAAIEALREPTEAMLDAGWNGSGEAAETWAAMIAAALNGPAERGSET